MRIFEILKSRYCVLVFIVTLTLSYLITPRSIFVGYYAILAGVFIIVFAFTFTCLTRTIKDAIVQRTGKKSIIGIISGIIGFSALQVCTVGAPLCSVSIGSALFSVLLPGIAFDFIRKYSIFVVILSTAIQIFSLFQMRCFKTSTTFACNNNTQIKK